METLAVLLNENDSVKNTDTASKEVGFCGSAKIHEVIFMKKIMIVLNLLMLSSSIFAIEVEDQVFVEFNGRTIDILELSNLKGSGVNSLLQLNKNSCYLGNQIKVIDSLNDIFNMVERSSSTLNWKISFRQATTPKIPEQNAGLKDSIGIEYEILSGNFPIIRFLINRCE